MKKINVLTFPFSKVMIGCKLHKINSVPQGEEVEYFVESVFPAYETDFFINKKRKGW